MSAPAIPVGRYDRNTVALHWTTALLVVLQWTSASALSFVEDHGLRMIYWNLHFVLGLGIFGVVVLRLWWRQLHGQRLPPLSSGLPDLAARMVHALLYALVLWLVALGLAIIALRGWPLAGLFTVPPIAPGYRPASTIVLHVHGWSADALMVVASGHAAVALIHHYVLKDCALYRMSFGRTAQVTETRAP